MLNEKDVMKLLADYNITAVAQDVRKNNNVTLRGITIGDGELRPTLYLNYYNDAEELLKDAIRYQHQLPDMEGFNPTALTDWNYVRTKLRVRLSKNPETNFCLSAFCDLKMTVYVKLANNAVVHVKRNLFEQYGIGFDVFFKRALDNTREYEGSELLDLNKMIEEATGMDMGKYPGCDSMHVLTNKSRCYGASAILYSRDILPDKFYMIPSSVHETILIYPTDLIKPDGLNEIIKEVNQTELDPVIVLSDHAYCYENGWWTSI